MIDEAPEIEESPLSGIVTREGIAIRVEIYRLVEGDESWTLEVIDPEGGSTVWEDRFATDKEAYAEFYRTLETDGIKSFLEDSPTAAMN
jgi:C4-type Zn-finger protein